MSKLRISHDLSLPEDVITSTTIVYGGKGMGKTNFGSVLVEEISKARLRWSVLDPMGVWWGLRHSKDGKGPGIECVILGGVHGDIPIEPTGGSVVADLVIDEATDTIVDFSRRPDGRVWGVGEKIRFVTDYTKRVFERQGELINGRRREPLIQIYDEAARFVPQIIPAGNPDLAKCVAVIEQACEEGRNFGLGMGFLTQRSARMNKSVSELADAMFAFRTFGPRSLEAIMDWLGEHVEKARVKELAAKVRELNIGQALVVSPGWLRVEKIVQIRERETFDSSATPKAGQKARRVTGAGAKPDLAKYRERMAATIEKAKADDPKELKKRVAELTGQIRQLETQQNKVGGKVIGRMVNDRVAIDRAVKTAVGAERKRLWAQLKVASREAESLIRTAKLASEKAADTLQGSVQFGDSFKSFMDDLSTAAVAVTVEPATRVPVNATLPKEYRARIEPPDASDGSISGAQDKIIQAIGTLQALGVDEPSIVQVALFNGVSHTTGSYLQNLRELEAAGYIQRGKGTVKLTLPESAVSSARDGILRDGMDVVDFWYGKLDGAKAKLLRAVVDRYPDAISKVDLAAAVNVSPTTGSYQQNVRDLRTYGIVEVEDGQVRASDLLFPASVR